MNIIFKKLPFSTLNNWRYHFLFWHLYMILINPGFLKTGKFIDTIIGLINFYSYCSLVIFIVVYLQAYLLYWFGKTILQKLIVVSSCFMAYYLLRIGLNTALLSLNITPFTTISSDVFVSSLVNWFFFSAFGLCLYFAESKIDEQVKLQTIEKENIEKDLEIIEEKRKNALLFIENQRSELAKLKAQINPHFLFNSLNFFYSEIRPLNNKAADSIMLLSDILRYSLIEQKNQNLVEIEGELEYLENYIQLQRNRFHDNFYLNLTINAEEDLNNKKIPPMLLLTLVENCFKYGDLHNPENPCDISIEVTNNTFVFQMKNKIQTSASLFPSSGHGLANIRERLRLIYDKNIYIFDTKVDNNHYVCLLHLPFI